MVESPTYYHSLSPVLRSLKEFDMENVPLQKEIIYAETALELPKYLAEATFDTSAIFSPMLDTYKSLTNTNPSDVEGALLNYTPVEQMDTDGIPENNMHSKSTWKTEQSVDVKEPADATASSEPGSREKLGGRMNVERFLAVFNSNSESSLEASQCGALIHALTNKLAVIQGTCVFIMAHY